MQFEGYDYYFPMCLDVVLSTQCVSTNHWYEMSCNPGSRNHCDSSATVPGTVMPRPNFGSCCRKTTMNIIISTQTAAISLCFVNATANETMDEPILWDFTCAAFSYGLRLERNWLDLGDAFALETVQTSELCYRFHHQTPYSNSRSISIN